MDNLTSLSLARLVIGGAAWVAPTLGLKVAMLDSAAPQAPYLLRLFGARDVALGALTLMAAPEQRPTLLKIGIAVDSADAAAAALAMRGRALGKVTGLLLTGVGVAAAAAGAAALAEQK